MFALASTLAERSPVSAFLKQGRESKSKKQKGGKGLLTREFLLEVLVVFVAEAVGGDVGASFGIANVLHLVRVFFEADFAEIPQGAQDSRHLEGEAL